MFKKLLKPRALCLSAVIAAIYAVLTIGIPVISYGEWQCRIAEALTLLPILLPESILGLFVGCVLSNIFNPAGFVLADIIFGSLATLIAALCTYSLRHKPWPLAALPPVVLNGVIVGAMLSIVYALPLWLTMLQVAAGEAVACYVLGGVLLKALKRVDLTRITQG